MYTVDLTDVVIALTRALEFTKEELAHHHERVAYIAATIGKKFNLPDKEYETLFWASYLHDLGAGAKLVDYDLQQLDKYDQNHALLGYELLKDVPFFTEVAEVIKHHHTKYLDFQAEIKNSPVAFLSQIIFVADQIDLLLSPRKLALLQRSEIKRYFTKNKKIFFNSDIVDAFLELSEIESFWLDLTGNYVEDRLEELRPKTKLILDENQLKLLTIPFARIIDAKSPFTEKHSFHVSFLSGKIAELTGFQEEKTLIEIAGLLHDIGKLAISSNILEKNGSLTDEEYELIKSHSYHTYYLLKKIAGFENVARWAGFHHEQPNGQGYPFRASGEALCLPSRIIALADKWVALTEKRPYRDALDPKTALEILEDMAKKEIIDKDLFQLFKNNIDLID